MKSVTYSQINDYGELIKARFLLLANLLLFLNFNVWGQGTGCVNGPTVNLGSSGGSTCGLSPVTISGSFGGSATKVTITENGGGSVSPGSITATPFEFKYTPKNKDNGKNVTITVTTNNPLGSPCAAATTTLTLSIGAGLSAPVIGTITNTSCAKQTGSVVLSGLPPGGPWLITRNPGGLTTGCTVTSTTISDLEPGTYSFTVTNTLGCTSSKSGNVVISASTGGIAEADAGTGGHICGLNFTFNAILQSGIGTWTKISGPGNVFFAPGNNLPAANVNVDQAGTYDFAWNVNNNSCISSDIVRVIFHDLPSLDPGPGLDTTICKGASLQLHAKGTGFFSWTPSELFSNPNISDPVATPVASTTFTVSLTDQFGCENSSDIKVGLQDKPAANAGPDQVLTSSTDTKMEAVLYNNNDKGVWSLISGTGEFFDSTYAKTSLSGLSQNRNEFKWTVANGVCSASSDTVVIIVSGLVIPTLITPNMDGKNDYFVLRGFNGESRMELVIFDRRGAEVYKNGNYNNEWNGIDYNKNPLPDDTYFYVLKTKNDKSMSGFIVVRR